MESASKLLTPREVASRLEVHENTVRRWSREGYMPFVKIGRRLYIPEAEFQRFIARDRIERLG